MSEVDTVFECPKCGGCDFRSDITKDPWIRGCKGIFHSEGGRFWYDKCDFRWPATDDHLYLKPKDGQMSNGAREVTDEEFERAMAAVRGELRYQDSIVCRTKAEASDPPGFFTLIHEYLRQGEAAWVHNAGNELAMHSLRKLAGICVRGMIYCGVRNRDGF